MNSAGSSLTWNNSTVRNVAIDYFEALLKSNKGFNKLDMTKRCSALVKKTNNDLS